MVEEKSRVEATHISVRYTICVDNSLCRHLRPPCSGLVFVNPLRLVPVFSGYLAKMHRRVGKDPHSIFEVVREGLLVEQNPWIAMVSIKPILHLLNTRYDAIDIVIAAKKYESCVCSFILPILLIGGWCAMWLHIGINGYPG
jgi:hypothetical protein